MMIKKAILIILFLCLAGLVQAQPAIPTGATTLEAYDMPGYFMTATSANSWVGYRVRLVEGTNVDPSGQWTIGPGNNGDAQAVTFYPVVYPDRMLRHSGFVIYCSTGVGTSSDGSWIPRPGWADPNNPRLVSFESTNFPGRFLLHENTTGTIAFRNDPVSDTSSDVDKARATFLFPDPTLASNPNPRTRSTEVSRDVGAISWKPGSTVVEENGTHNVFFGTDEDSVTNATVADAAQLGVTLYQDLAIDVNSIALSRLEFGTTYYWRVDEVATSGTVTGMVWSFTIELKGYTLGASHITATANNGVYADADAQDPNSTCNGSGLDANDMHSTDQKTMWLAMGEPGECYIQYDFDNIYKLNDIKIWNYNEVEPTNSFGAKDVNIVCSLDGETWTQVGDTVTLDMAPGDNTCAANAPIDLQGVATKYVKIIFWSGWDPETPAYGISEVRFSTIPTYSVPLAPANNATNQAADAVLSWKAGRDVNDHYVYVSTDPNALGNPNIINGSVTFAPVLNLNQTYYWRVDEVNDAEAYPVWEGTVWKFSTAMARSIDGFETGYDDSDANAVWATWKDNGLGDRPENGGSQMGNYDAPYLSTINHSGGHSSPLNYDDTGAYTFSQVVAQSMDLPIGSSDWSLGSPKALVIWFRGEPNNIPDQMYVKLNDSKVLYDGDPIGLTQSVWRPWSIDLSVFNVDLTNVTSITIGFEKTASQAGKGTILIDEVSLYAVAPETASVPVDPGTDDLIAYYAMENNVLDSSGNGHNGTIVGAPTYVPGPTGHGMALQLNPAADSNDFVDLGASEPNEAFNPAGSFSISLWANITGWSDQWGEVMIGNRGENGIGWQLRRGADDHFCFTTRGPGSDDTYSVDNPPPLNEWVNITCVYDSEAHTKSIYLDGVLDTTVSTSATNTVIAPTTVNTYIGARANSGNTGTDGTGTLFNGTLDEIRIYNRALSADEALFLANPNP